MLNPLFRGLMGAEYLNPHSSIHVLLPFFWLQPTSLFGCLQMTKIKDTSLSLPVGVLLAGNQIRLPARTAFIPASRIEDHSLPWGKCCYPQHLGRETWVYKLTKLNPYNRSSRTLTDIQLSWFIRLAVWLLAIPC